MCGVPFRDQAWLPDIIDDKVPWIVIRADKQAQCPPMLSRAFKGNIECRPPLTLAILLAPIVSRVLYS